MFTLYTVLLTLHILAVIAWLGAGVTVHTITALSGDDPAWPRIFTAFAEKWFAPISGVTGLLGILLWIDGPWELGELWILLAVVGWIASSVIGATRLSPSVKRWAEGDAAGRVAYRRFAPIDITILVLIVADMVIKPGL